MEGRGTHAPWTPVPFMQFRGLATLLLALLVCGCADQATQPPTFAAWRGGVERYVWDQGNGDPNILADASWDDVHPGFAMISDPLPDRSTDLIGLLVGHRRVGNRPHFLFILATVRKGKLEDLQLVALEVAEGTFHWSKGESNPDSLARYIAGSDAGRKTMDAQGLRPPPFPRPGDQFDLQIVGQEAMILHERTSAVWQVRISTEAPTEQSQHAETADESLERGFPNDRSSNSLTSRLK